jgi:hypothetical protein
VRHWLPSIEEERWLATAAILRGVLPRGALDERAGRWRTIGLLGRIALAVLGLVAAALLFGIASLMFRGPALLIAGLVAIGTAEWLKLEKRLHAAGIEEALCSLGYVLVATWLADKIMPVFHQSADLLLAVVTVASLAAGLRLLNPFLTTVAACAFLAWCDTTTLARSLNETAAAGTTSFGLAMVGAAVALVAGRRNFVRPSHDRMLDWLVVVLPLYAYAAQFSWNPMRGTSFAHGFTAWWTVRMLFLLAFAATSLVVALRRRRHAPLLAMLICVTCVALEGTRVFQLRPETWLLVYGVATILLGAVLDRYLRTSRNGITSARLSGQGDTLDLLQSTGAAVLSARTSPVAPTEAPEYAGEGGRFGGGGANGSF